MRRARLVVLPSLVDNLPNVLLEAMMFGRPVIATQGASFDELIEDGYSGFLVPPGDPLALAAKIVDAWNRPDLDMIGRRASDAVAPLAPSVTIPATLDYLRRIATQGTPDGRRRC
jgi:glycosyltransferase involved in cell wall biosynthesis